MALVVLALAASVAGCYTAGPGHRGGVGAPRGPVMAQPAGPGSPPPQQQFDQRLIDPKLEKAIADYWRDLRTLGWHATDNEIRRSLRLLAIATEQVPYTGSVDLHGAAGRVRGGRSHRPAQAAGMFAPPRDESSADIDKPLQEMARAFVELAKGPYREGVGVLAAAYAFENAVQAMSAARARGGDRRAAFEVLGKGEEILLAIRGAIGRGEVGLLDTAPPPAEFGL